MSYSLPVVTPTTSQVIKSTAQTIALWTGLLSICGAANAQSRFGAITGLIKSPAKTAIAEATVTALQVDGGAVRATISNSEGLYSFADLAPGTYSVVAQTAGSPDATVSPVQVAAGRATRVDVTFTEPVTISSTSSNPAKPEPVLVASVSPPSGPFSTSNATGVSTSRPTNNFWNRWMRGEKTNWKELTAQYPASGAAQGQGAGNGQSSSRVVPLAKPGEAAPPAIDLMTPFADGDWTWLNGNTRQKDFPLDSKYFSGEFRADTFFGLDFNQPKDHSMGGSSEVFRNGEFQLEDLSIGGDFHAGNMRGRVLALFGMFAATTVRNDASPAVGQWDVRSAYKYVSEAYGGYHFNVQHGINVDAGIFVSYVGLFSYHNFDNWAYQPSYVSSNTPWFFNGLRIQWFPTQHLKIEPWIINGWQSYNKFNGHPGVGGQIKWTPKPWMEIIANQYAVGNDNVGLPHRGRYHTDDSIEIKYYDNPNAGNGINRMAFTFTGDMGCETGQGVTCHGGKGGPKQSFIGYMVYNRWWWHRDLFGFTLGGGQINNQGRYLALVLPINGADAISGTPYFPSYPGAPFKAYDGTATFDWMPSQFMTFRTEFGYRHTNVPYWSGRGGITPPGGNNGFPGQYVCNDGSPSMTMTGCGSVGLWSPDLRKGQALLSFAIMVKL